MKNLNSFLHKIISFSLRKIFSSFLVALVIASSFPIKNSYASVDYGIGRTRSCNIGDDGVPKPEGLDFNPTSGGKDVQFVLSNPVCLTVIAVAYVQVKITVAYMNSTCGTGSGVPRVTPTPLMDLWDIGKATVQGPKEPNCIGAIAAATTSLGIAIAELAVIYGIANGLDSPGIHTDGVYQRARICGSNWMQPNATTYNFSTPGYKQEVENQINGWLRSGQTSNLSMSNKTYREWYYGGVEIDDNPNDGNACYDVTQAKVDDKYPAQKYYLKGTEIGNYNCKKYYVQPGQNDPLDNQPLTEARKQDLDKAYKCCMSRMKSYICLQYDGVVNDTNLFCPAGSRCVIDGITFSTKFLDNDRMICAETYSLCPYNFSIGGGSEYCDYYRDGIWSDDQGRWVMITPEQVAAGTCTTYSEIRNQDCTYNDKAGKCKNYCQYLTHCAITSDSYPYTSGLGSPYFSEACLNFEGDSQNKTAFGGGFILGSQKHFSAPIAQCVKETLENVFYNRAGHSKCLNINEYPSKGGTCASGLYVTDGNFVFKKGNNVKIKSFFTTVQDNLQLAVKLVLTMSIMFYGMNILTGKADIRNKKDILVYLLKIGLVMYFATGDAWQSQFFNGVYGASSEFSRMVFKIEVQPSESQRDGCQFGNISLPDGTEISSGTTYPDGKAYLAIWDTLDCKIMRYLGFGPEVSAANIASLILASWLTGPIGLYFAFSVFIFAILLIAATIRALHIFLSSAISIIIMVFVSPIIIPLALFEKTKSIFDGWLKELISFCLQPMILFAYIAIFIIVMDRTLIGSAEFSGPPPFKTLNCEKKCTNPDGTIDPYVNGEMPLCDQLNQEIINPLDDSVACLLNFNSFGTFPGLEIFGLTIPIVINLFSSNVKERILTLLKGALMMFLIYKFMDEIPGITSALIGGTALPGSNADALSMFKKVLGTAAAIQQRAGRGSQKAIKSLGGKAREGIGKAGDKGKSTAEPKTGSGSDSTGSSGGNDSTGGGNSSPDSTD